MEKGPEDEFLVMKGDVAHEETLLVLQRT